MGKFELVLKNLETWFLQKKRDLPWRDQPTLYRVWISEIMLQQTQVKTVIPYYEKFLQRFPSVEELAQTPEEEVLRYWAGLGYYSRARNLLKGARQIVQAGAFPQTREGWLEVPGVGPYTAGAIVSIALDQPVAILDGNVERVLSRFRRVFRKPTDQAFKNRLWRLSRIFVETADRLTIRPHVLNQALMELGATVCSPSAPQCGSCPLRAQCRGFERGDAEAFPPRRKAAPFLKVQEHLHCVLSPQGRVLLRKREKGEWREGLWDLLEKNPKELNASFQAKKMGVVQTQHVVTRHKIERTTEVWMAAEQTEAFVSLPHAGVLRWVSVSPSRGEKVAEVAMGSALKRTLKEVQKLAWDPSGR